MTSNPSDRCALPQLRVLTLSALTVAAALAVSGCDRAEAPGTNPTMSSPAAPAATAPAATAPAASASPGNPAPGTADGAAASLPSSASAGKAPTAASAVDDKETDPKSNMSKQEETQSMPQALQSNNHSSPALDRDTSKP